MRPDKDKSNLEYRLDLDRTPEQKLEDWEKSEFERSFNTYSGKLSNEVAGFRFAMLGLFALIGVPILLFFLFNFH